MRTLGRINRATYWLAVAVIVAAGIVVALVTHAPLRGADVLLLIVAIPRLHDIGRAAWWALGVLVVEFVAGIVLAKILPAAQLLPSIGVIALVMGALAIVLGCLRGQSETNRFGPQPARGVSYSEPPRA